jgi:hypothetical protein
MDSLIPSNNRCLTFLIDNSTAGFSGHTWEYAKVFRNAYSELGKDFIFLTPLSKENQTQINNTHAQARSMSEVISSLSETIMKSELEVFHIFILWAHQFEISNHRALASLIPPKGKHLQIQILGKFPGKIGRFSNNEQNEFEKSIFDTYATSKCNVKFLAWDPMANSDSSETQLLPLTEHFEYTKYVLKSELQIDYKKNFEINFFGSLTFNRGVGYLILLALSNPNLKFILTGSGSIDRSLYRPEGYRTKSRTLGKWLIGLTISMFLSCFKKLPNIKLRENHFYPAHIDLEKEIKKSKIIFYSSRSSGISSGIVNMAMKFGIRPIFLRGNSPASDLLQSSFPQGRLSWVDFLPLMLTRKIAKVKNDLVQVPPITKEPFLQDLQHLCSFHQ